MGFPQNISDLASVPVQATPTLKYFTLAGGASQRIVAANPYRVTLIISAFSAGVVMLRNDSATTQNGIVLTTASPTWVFRQADDGLLVSLEWWATTQAAGGAQMAFIEQVVTQFGQAPGQSNLIRDTDNGLFSGRSARPAHRISRAKQYGNRWAKPQALSPYGLPADGNAGIRVLGGTGGVGGRDAGSDGEPAADFWRPLSRQPVC